jgi:hypothetical protein
MTQHVKHPFSEYLLIESYNLEVRAVDGGWEILCPPGPLAQFLLALSGSPQAGSRNGYVIIPLTADLDRAIMALIRDLIDLRYRTGQVQLELWANL